jgi:hypothetical protein
VPLLRPIGTYGIRFTLLRGKQAWLNNKLVMDKSSDDPIVLCELANGYVTAELVNFIFDVSVHPNGIHCLQERDDMRGQRSALRMQGNMKRYIELGERILDS